MIEFDKAWNAFIAGESCSHGDFRVIKRFERQTTELRYKTRLLCVRDARNRASFEHLGGPAYADLITARGLVFRQLEAVL